MENDEAPVLYISLVAAEDAGVSPTYAGPMRPCLVCFFEDIVVSSYNRASTVSILNYAT
jgi:hypothetical protein